MSDGVGMARGCFLVLDDDPVNRSLIRAILTRSSVAALRDAAVLEAASLAEARAVLAAQAIDLLLLDVHLPDGLGTELAAEIPRGRPDRPAILALTASVLPVDQQAALDAGCDAFLAKPYPAQDLVDTSLRLLGRRASAMADSAVSGMPPAGRPS